MKKFLPLILTFMLLCSCASNTDTPDPSADPTDLSEQSDQTEQTVIACPKEDTDTESGTESVEALSYSKFNLLDGATPSSSALMFYEYDGSTASYYAIFNDNDANEILDALAGSAISPTDDFSIDSLEPPFYGISIGSEDETLFTLFCGDYCIASDGTAYRFEPFDFSSITEEEYEAELLADSMSPLILPCSRWICEENGEWNAKFMVESVTNKPSDTNGGITAEIVSVEDGKVTVKYTNNGNGEWGWGEPFSLDVKIGDTWYTVPPIPGDLGFIEPLYMLAAGASTEKTYSLSFYVDLPSGEYRIIANGFAIPFEIE